MGVVVVVDFASKNVKKFSFLHDEDGIFLPFAM